MLHPLWATSHLMCLIALALLSAQCGKLGMRALWLALTPSLILGLVLTRFISLSQSDYYLLAASVFIGSIIALRPPRLPLSILIFAALLVGLFIGLASTAPSLPGMKTRQLVEHLVAVALGSALMLASAQVIAYFLNKPSQGLAVRILGAWITAGASMVLALMLLAPLSPLKP